MTEGTDTPYRAHGRRNLRLRLVVWHPRAGWQREARTRNVSLGGARIALDAPLDRGDVVVVSFVGPRPAYMPAEDPATLDPTSPAVRPDAPSIEARVAWIEPVPGELACSAGLAFAPRDPAVLLALFQRIRAHNADE